MTSTSIASRKSSASEDGPRVIYWTSVIAPGDLVFYKGAMFPRWQGSALIGGLVSKALNRTTFDGKGARPRPSAGMWATDS